MKDRGTLKSLVVSPISSPIHCPCVLALLKEEAWTFTMGACTTGYGMYYIYSLFVNDFGK